MVRKLWFTLAAGVLVLSAAACGGGSDEDADLQIDLADFSIELSTETLPAGDLTLSASNAGPTTHEFEVFSMPADVDLGAIEIADDVADVDAAGLTVIDEVEDIVAGTTAELNLSLEPGTYAVICNLPEHYAQGMHASFTVE
ncbi:MAG TPA: plastocyanin/azurin family copper-binding protein [Actinomycetota bacterium]